MIRTALSFAALFAVMVPAQAEPIAVHFAGTVTDILLDDSSGAFGSNFSVGQVVSGSWTFDSNAAIVAKLDNMTAYASSFEVKIGSLAFSGSAEYRIFNDSPAAGDGLTVLNETGTYVAPALEPLVPGWFFVHFLGMPISTLSSQALVKDPGAIAPLADQNFAPSGLRLDNPDGSFGILNFSVAVVPEPATWGFMTSGLVLIGWATRRRHIAKTV